MNIFKILSNSIFDGANVEAYSFWIKKRVTVFEYGPHYEGKLKLGIEPFNEEGALVNFEDNKCKLKLECGEGIDALFIWRSKEMSDFVLTAVSVLNEINDLIIENTIRTADCLSNILKSKLQLILITDNAVEDRHKELLRISFSRFQIVPYSDYLGRSWENFIKGIK